MTIFIDIMLVAFIYKQNLSFLYFDYSRNIQIHEVDLFAGNTYISISLINFWKQPYIELY